MKHPYASAAYAKGFAEIAEPIYLENADTWILKRAIPNTNFFDVMGCYPRCVINPEADLKQDFAKLQKLELASLVVVTDILYRPEIDKLKQFFDTANPFKTHYFYNPEKPYAPDRDLRYKIRRAQALSETKIVSLADHLDEWCMLYDQLVQKHNVTGLQKFSPYYFQQLAQLENLIAIGTFNEGNLTSMTLWLESDGVVYSHLSASNHDGYTKRAPYAIYGFALEHFKGNKLIDLGGGAGSVDDPNDGLVVFKKCFANDTALSYLCGKILNPVIYQELCHAADKATTGNYFPAYRS